jgi:hypothetical protein
MEKGIEVWRWRLATRAPQDADSGVGHNPRPNGASTEGQQVWSEATSWATAWIQSTTTTISIGTAATTEGKTDFSYGTTTLECNGVTVIKFSWATTATSCTQACGETYADKT